MTADRPFNLVRWFSVVLVGVLAASAITAGLLLSRFIEDRLLALDADTTRAFVQTVTRAENAEVLAFSAEGPVSDALSEFFSHIAQMPEVVRTNVYGRDRRVLWSSDLQLVGRRFPENDELDDALRGEVVFKRGYATPQEGAKPEHVSFREEVFFVESYIPIYGTGIVAPVAVVEVYKLPRQLESTLNVARALVWSAAVAVGVILFLALHGFIRRAARLIATQQERIVEAETMATVGEMGSTLAHSIRNPLASIRSSAELALEDPACSWRGEARDIIDASARIENSVRDLLLLGSAPADAATPVAVNDVAVEAMAMLKREFERKGVADALALDPADPRVLADAASLRQVLSSLVVNSLEACGPGARIEVSTATLPGHGVEVAVRDSGPGIPAADLPRVLKPFHTSKPKGLGLGLPLAKRLVERHGGTLSIASAPGEGTTIRLRFPGALA
ncbi:MAG: HAMP domain-containing sensor histidine kinase [Burkholderiales bacterium]